MNKKQRLTIGDMVDYKGNLYRALGESNEAKNSVIVMRTKQKLEPPYQEQGIDMRAADLNQDEGMNTSSSAPLSADSLREAIKLTVGEAVVFTTDNTLVPNIRVTIEGATDRIMDLFAAALQAERQRIADSLPEIREPKNLHLTMDNGGFLGNYCDTCKIYTFDRDTFEETGAWCLCYPFNEALDDVRAVLETEGSRLTSKGETE